MLYSNNQPRIECGESAYTIGAASLQQQYQILYDKIDVAYTAQHISSDNIERCPPFITFSVPSVTGGLRKAPSTKHAYNDNMCYSLVF